MTGRDQPIRAATPAHVSPAIHARDVNAADICNDCVPAALRDDCCRHCAHSDRYCDYRLTKVNGGVALYAHDIFCDIRDNQRMQPAFSPEWFEAQFARTGKSQAELYHHLSALAGLDRSKVNKSVNGKRQVQQNEMPLVWEFFGLDPAGLVPALAARSQPHGEQLLAVSPAQPSTQLSTPNATRPEYRAFAPAPRIPVYGQAAAGRDGRFVMNGQRVADTFCPPALAGVEGAYAVYVHGDSMEPRFRAGETVWINPHQPVRQGDDVVVQVLTSDIDDGEPPSAYVKRFVSRGSELVLHQFNPPEGETDTLRFPEHRVVSVHRIVFAGIG